MSLLSRQLRLRVPCAQPGRSMAGVSQTFNKRRPNDSSRAPRVPPLRDPPSRCPFLGCCHWVNLSPSAERARLHAGTAVLVTELLAHTQETWCSYLLDERPLLPACSLPEALPQHLDRT